LDSVVYGPVLIQRYTRGEYQTDAELDKIAEIVAQWRERLMDIGWSLHCLNKHMAQKANEEDNYKECFWEKSFSAKQTDKILLTQIICQTGRM